LASVSQTFRAFAAGLSIGVDAVVLHQFEIQRDLVRNGARAIEWLEASEVNMS
jgi:hypothetical protein